ncbi:MAG: hypothetical protein SFW36_16380 [Leptolyngbyaceae cyanobacterium bins.59]|nr:hypothetical protein [Leptolyngbyaceae cyanobacterium bins.59]
MEATTLEIVKAEYQAGRITFERGLYRESVQHLEKASALVSRPTRLGGEVQLWLVTAYEAAGQRTEAIDLCKQLTRHPDMQSRQQARRVLYILEAPQLSTRPEWLTQIPDLTKLEGTERPDYTASVPRKPRPPKPKPQPEPEDLSKINTQDNRFIWFALGAAVLVLGGVAWFGM